MKFLVRSLITSGIVLGGIFALVLVPALDRRGLPGGLLGSVRLEESVDLMHRLCADIPSVASSMRSTRLAR